MGPCRRRNAPVGCVGGLPQQFPFPTSLNLTLFETNPLAAAPMPAFVSPSPPALLHANRQAHQPTTQ